MRDNSQLPYRSYQLTYCRHQELMELISEAAVDTTDSPEIGPPPVSQFVDEDPVKIDLPNRLKKDEADDLSGLDPALSINLEQRRKRRDSASGSESRRASKIEPPQAAQESTGSLKTGAKRKFSVRDDEELEVTAKSTDASLEEFQFIRISSEEKARNRPLSRSEKSASRVARELAVARGAPREKQSATAAPTSRKVLAPKSVNESPRKSTKAVVDDIKAAKADIPKANHIKERSRESRQEPVLVRPPSSGPLISTIEVLPEPETPTGLDLFSPISSQPSTTRAEPRDTPPPPDLGPGTQGQRPSRRARASISYVEPSLRDKMRRPTKELIDAVVPTAKLHNASTIKGEEEGTSAFVRIKTEADLDDAWKRMPVASSATVENSPLSGKAPVPEPLPNSITTHRRRRESILHQAETELPQSGSGSSVAALLAGNRRAEVKHKIGETIRVEAAAAASLDIYDFRGSSPAPAEEVEAKSTKEEKPPSRFSRRHYSISRELLQVDDRDALEQEGPRKADVSTSRRRQSTLGLRNSSASIESSKEEAEKAVKRASSSIGMTQSGANGTQSERTSSRRRSMML